MLLTIDSENLGVLDHVNTEIKDGTDSESENVSKRVPEVTHSYAF